MAGKSSSDDEDLSTMSTDQLAFEAFTGRKAPTRKVTVPVQQPELGVPAKKIMTGPQALELGRAAIVTAKKRSS